jgi:hypothetical protein
METIDVSSLKLPLPNVLFQPAAYLGSLPPRPAHPKIAQLHAEGLTLIELLEPLATEIRVDDLQVSVHEEKDPSADEPARVTLEAARQTVAALTGTQGRIFERDLARFVGHLAPRYLKAKDDAVAKLNQLRAVLAFFLGETDDEQLGYQFVPPPPPIGESSPSVEVDLT